MTRSARRSSGATNTASNIRIASRTTRVSSCSARSTPPSAAAGDPRGIEPPADEIAYLCDVANQHFRATLGPADVVWSFAGVRSLYDDGSRKAQDVTRDYVLTLDQRGGEAPLLTIYGGKITTYRRLAEHALDRLAQGIAIGSAWTKDSPLPGGEFPYYGGGAPLAQTTQSRPFLSDAHA